MSQSCTFHQALSLLVALQDVSGLDYLLEESTRLIPEYRCYCRLVDCDDCIHPSAYRGLCSLCQFRKPGTERLWINVQAEQD